MIEQNRNKRIAKNTLFMYLRMTVLMLISLYTVRIVLKNLGIEDYGIYNLIGGIVVLFSFISNSSAAATQRFLNFALGENDSEKVKKIYSQSIILHIFISLIFFILSEVVGLWAVNYYLNIPESRIFAANWVFQISLLTTIVGIIKIPYNAAVIAYERMSFYAIMSIFDGLCKFCIALLISIIHYDKLIFYSFLVLLANFLWFIIQKIFVNIQFKECKFVLIKDKSSYKELLSFSGWSLLSSIGSTCSNQVLTMILNRFFGVIANAAMGIANQVNNAVYQLISNFQIAFEPQITKSYAANEKEYLQDLIFKTSKFSFFLLWFFVLPLSLNANIVLKVWLSEVPEYSVIFLRIILIFSLVDALTGPLWMISYAIGNIRNYQFVAFCFSLLNIPIAWIMFKLGLPSYSIMILRVCSNVIFSLWRMGYLYNRIKFPVIQFLKNVFIPVVYVVIISFIFSFGTFILLQNRLVLQFFISCTVTVFANIISIWLLGCNKNERAWIVKITQKLLFKHSTN